MYDLPRPDSLQIGALGHHTRKDLIMIRHPHYLELPWNMHWYPAVRQHRHSWWLILLLVVLAIVMMGTGAASGLL